ncbi:hypothetical protein [Thalassospira xiamenensis]|uniref:Uncharacterized protein n=1 Tax=Thalassospira xiamenensis TaxID=220697 RepID=A0A367XHQ9_9PROT|nr:hypothetical protein [Thalassospira xiamenensis]KZB51096.1 hypothetical protein AUP41_08295 [Thalassospira xiamenensis]RCK53178.1 hypothetical protein TH44_02985 [Thalassospira xiamenensis]
MSKGRSFRQEVVRDLLPPNACLTIDELASALPEYSRRDIVKATVKLISRGLLERVERGCYQLTPKGIESRDANEALTSGPNEPLTAKTRTKKGSTLRRRVWRVMAVKQKFTIDDLLSVSTRGEEKNARNNVQKYLRCLCKAGYLRELRRTPGEAITSNGFKRYQLIRHTGPLAPVLRQGGVYDSNTGEFHERNQ